MRKKVLITGSSGLVGSEAVAFFDREGWDIHGIDNNMRATFFGPDGDTSWNLKRLKGLVHHFSHYHLDVRDRQGLLDLVKQLCPHLVIHCAAQPSHDLAKQYPFEDFEINALGTLNLLEATRRYCPESPFIFMSTNKVYGDAPNEIPLIELKTRYDYINPKETEGVDESCRVDACLHSLFGVSKLAADEAVQEYGRYFSIPTVCFRAGCITGPNHSGAELHGFLSYLARAIRQERVYRIYGYKGKQVRDNLHSYDLCRAFLAFYQKPRIAAVYNLGGGRANSISVIEAIVQLEERLGKKLKTEYLDQPRLGDHICYISNLRRFKTDYPSWEICRSLEQILDELAQIPYIPS